jgi:2'-5' RNA ligase
MTLKRSLFYAISYSRTAFQVEVQGLGAFPDQRPRVVWLGLLEGTVRCGRLRGTGQLASRENARFIRT